MNENRIRYTPLAMLLHWAIAGLIVLQFALMQLAERAEDAGREAHELLLVANHRSVGITILVLAIYRLLWRKRSPPPAMLPMPAWQATAATWMHRLFYGLLFVIPLTGWALSSASADAVTWFGIVPLPDIAAESHDLHEFFEEVHEVLANLLFVIALVHVAAAVKHAVLDRQPVLQRIASPASLALFVVVVAGGIAVLAVFAGD